MTITGEKQAKTPSLNQIELAEKIQSKTPIAVDFWAEWCGPCRRLGPIIDELYAMFQGKLAIYKINIDDNREAAMLHEIKTIPTVIIFQEGKVLERIVGTVTKEELVKKFENYAIKA